MAEIQINSSTKRSGVKRIIKKSTKVDLTPMVDLGFLLITFFVFTTELTKPKVMDIVVPKDSDITTDVCESCVLTVMLDANDQIYYYEGMPENDPELKHVTFANGEIRDIFLKKQRSVKMTRGSEDDMVLIIKPSSTSVYRNFVDILDEVTITGIKHYFVDEINTLDKKIMKRTL